MSPKPAVTHDDTRNPKPVYTNATKRPCGCDFPQTDECECSVSCPYCWPDFQHDSFERWRPIRNAIICSLVIFGLLAATGLVYVHAAQARTNVVHPVPRPAGLLQARAQCPDTSSITECRAALRRALSAVSWQRHERLHQGAYGVDHAIRLASALYGVPIGELRRVGTCESHLHPASKNRTSTASGLFQFLDSTWARAGVPGFSVFDPYANAIAAARLVKNDGSWREWSCQP